MSLKELYDLYDDAKKSPESGINITDTRSINPTTKGNTMSFLSKVNHTTRKHLGSTGRVMATAGVVSGSAYMIGNKFDIDALQNPYVLVGLAVVGTVVSEGTMYVFGDDTAETVADAASIFKEVQKLSQAEADELYKALEATAGEASKDAIAGLKMLRGETIIPAKTPKNGGNAQAS